jgi:hypothetical protein
VSRRLKKALTAPWLPSSLLVALATGGRENRTCQMENVSCGKSGEQEEGWGGERRETLGAQALAAPICLPARPGRSAPEGGGAVPRVGGF